jgi:short-subunit dehydrogenase
MGFDLSDCHALVTGASRGIGWAVSEALASRGARLTLVARPSGGLDAAFERLSRRGARAQVVAADLADPVAVDTVVPRAVAGYGKIDVLVNNAGIYRYQATARARVDDWDAMLAVNLRAPMVLSRAVLPYMLSAGRGAIINIASVAGKVGFDSHAGYCASKFGLVGFSRALFEEVRDQGVVVSVICPGMVRTDMTADVQGANRDRMLEAGDVARAVMFVLEAGRNAVTTEIDLWTQRDVFGG